MDYMTYYKGLQWIVEIGDEFKPEFDALRHQEQRSQNTERQEYPQGAADHIDPEVPDRLRLPASDAARPATGSELRWTARAV